MVPQLTKAHKKIKNHDVPKPHIIGSWNQGYSATDASNFRCEIGRGGHEKPIEYVLNMLSHFLAFQIM